MPCHRPRFFRDLTSYRLTRLVSTLIFFLLGSEIAVRADIVRDHAKAYYGRVQSAGAQGVVLLNGCSGADSRIISLSNLEEIDFGGPCSPPRVFSSSSPITAACDGPHGMLFTIVYASGDALQSLVATALVLDNGHVTLSLRNGTQIVGSSALIKRIYYQDQCFRFLRPDPAWNSVFTAK